MIGVVAQARMSSARLPGKVLRDLGEGRPVLEYVVERMTRAQRADVAVVATSDDESDDPVAELCARLGVPCHRGPLDDVAARVAGAAERLGLDAFVRVSADSPLIDQRLIDRGIELFEQGGADLVTNVAPRTFARGQSVEVVDAGALRDARRDMSDPADLEHVTRFLYANPARFRIRNFEQGGGRDHSEIHLTIDTADDAAVVSAIIARMERPHWEYGYDELIGLHREVTA